MGPEKCPFCGQEIDTEATKCFFCGAGLDEDSIENRLEQLHEENDRKPTRKVKCPLVLQALVITILICIVLFSGTSNNKPKLLEASTEISSVRLNAKITYTGAQFVISNNDSYDWINVELQITSESPGRNFHLRASKIPAGTTHTLRAAEFTMKDGTCFNPYTMKPERFWISCETPHRENGSYFAGWK
ncbi:MAG: hypothetical protein A2169_05330 [Deltaproteobacteria bacterium RBG_13_47_9]|nr:MAG: hypothetical protein A2169_05330 [Deltaproteobacteria bacterium RBG_13_47_9]